MGRIKKMESTVVERKLFVNPWTHRESPNFYANGDLTPRGKRVIDAKAKEIRESLQRNDIKP